MLNFARRVAPAACLALAILLDGHVVLAATANRYAPTEESLARHPVPAWFDGAKLGIFVHWGIYSVPGFAPREAHEFSAEEAGDEQKRVNPYAEWYYNTLRVPNSPTARFHRNAYGADFNYYDFARTFNAATPNWKPEAWADLFKDTGARYVVLTTKHHDGFTLWPSTVKNPHLRPDQSHSERDLVGELTRAVRHDGMKMGFYYSGLYDWSFGSGPFVAKDNNAQAVREQGADYPAYADAQWRELMAKYKPDILWNDIGYSPTGQGLKVAAEFYNSTPDGVINNRWQPFGFHDFITPEYAKLDSISAKKWEECRGLGKSFGINRIEGSEETITAKALVALLVDIVSKNGNLLLDVGPEPDGTIPDIQVDRLHQLGSWLKQNGEAIFDTKPWHRASGKTGEGIDVRFTTKGGFLYAILLDKPSTSSITLLDVPAPAQGKAVLLGVAGPLHVAPQGGNLTVELPPDLPGDHAWTIRLN